MTKAWSSEDKSSALEKAVRDGVDVLVIGGGITGAGIMREAASRGLNVLLIERGDFASGTSSASSKLVHGGLRYIAGMQFGMSRESCKERDLLVKNNPNLIQLMTTVFPSYKDDKVPLWKLRLGLTVYSAMANFRGSSHFKTLNAKETAAYCADMKTEGLKGAGVYKDGQTDDARLVLEAVKNGRYHGGEALNYTEATAFEHDSKGKITAVTVKDNISGSTYTLKPTIVINAAGPGVERVRGLDKAIKSPEIKPAKGVHLVIPADRIKSDVCLNYEAEDGRHLFLIPWGDVSLIGTTDTFSDEIDDPVVRMKDVEYILAATNKFFTGANLTKDDICSVFAGVRPLVADGNEKVELDDVSREHKIWEDPSGLISVAGGKLTTFRAMGEEVINKAAAKLPKEKRKKLKPSKTKNMPLRKDDFKAAQLEKTLCEKFNLAAAPAKHLIRNYGADSLEIINSASPDERETIGKSHFVYAEIPWAIKHESAANLLDILERRMRLAILTTDQGLPNLDKIVAVAGKAAGWDKERMEQEKKSYQTRIKNHYQVQPG